MDDATNMYLNAPVTSLQFKSLQRKTQREKKTCGQFN